MIISLNLDDNYRSSKLQGATNKGEPTASSEKRKEKENKKEEENE
jgi:hypothetical protein